LANKIITRLVEGLHVDQSGLENIKKLSANRKNKVILMPMYKTYGDAILMYYLNYLSDVELGFMIAMAED
jgi:hypothetical protein